MGLWSHGPGWWVGPQSTVDWAVARFTGVERAADSVHGSSSRLHMERERTKRSLPTEKRGVGGADLSWQ
jgi:hypothetical protein